MARWFRVLTALAGEQHPCQGAYNCLHLQLRQIQCPLLTSLGTWTKVCTPINSGNRIFFKLLCCVLCICWNGFALTLPSSEPIGESGFHDSSQRSICQKLSCEHWWNLVWASDELLKWSPLGYEPTEPRKGRGGSTLRTKVIRWSQNIGHPWILWIC